MDTLHFGLKEATLVPLYLLLIAIASFVLSEWFCKTKTQKYFFFAAITVKIIGAIFLGWLYIYYYGYGDTLRYFRGTSIIYTTFYNDPLSGIRLLFLSPDQYDGIIHNHLAKVGVFLKGHLFYNSSSRRFVQIGGFINLFCFNSYLVLNIVIAFLSFFGFWRMFQAFNKLFPSYESVIAFSVLLVPSVFFWSSGLLKESLMLSCQGYLIYYFVRIFIDKKTKYSYFLYLIVSVYLIYTIKPYIVLALIPCLILLVFLGSIKKIKSIIKKLIISPILIVIGFLIISAILTKLTTDIEKFSSFENIVEYSQVVQTGISNDTKISGGSGYNIGKVDYTFLGVISKAPISIFITLFKPFLWEVNNPIILFSAIENFFILLFTFYVLVVVKPYHFFTIVIKNPAILSFLLYVLIFSFAIGFTTFNYGTLVRYRIPILPVYLVCLFAILSHSKTLLKPTPSDI